jgi:hypothetical protein
MPMYHGSPDVFPEFRDPAGGGRNLAAGQAVWTAENPALASEFAGTVKEGSSPNVLPLYHRASKPASVRLSGKETNGEIAATLAEAWDSGFDAVRFQNYGGKGETIYAIKDPAQLRSVFAQFDPAKKNSRDLLASLIGAGALVPVAGASGTGQQGSE